MEKAIATLGLQYVKSDEVGRVGRQAGRQAGWQAAAESQKGGSCHFQWEGSGEGEQKRCSDKL